MELYIYIILYYRDGANVLILIYCMRNTSMHFIHFGLRDVLGHFDSEGQIVIPYVVMSVSVAGCCSESTTSTIVSYDMDLRLWSDSSVAFSSVLDVGSGLSAGGNGSSTV